MKSVKVTGTAAALLFGSVFLGIMFGQNEGRDDRHDKGGGRENAPGQQARPAPQQQAPQGSQGRPAPQQQAPPQRQERAQPPQQTQQAPPQQQQRQQRTEQAPPQQQPRVQQTQPQPERQRIQTPQRPQEQPQQHVQTPQQRPQEQQRYQQPPQTVQGRPYPQGGGQQQGSRPQYRQPERSQQQAQAWQQQRGWQRGGAWQGGQTFQQDRARNWSSEHRTWAQRGGYGGYYIPQDRFTLYFGGGHYFHIGILPTMYMGYPRFSYAGFTFLLLDPYPEYWATNWYDADDLYIDYDYDDGGYYLYNRRYPNDRLAVTVQL